jgi:hypothetical protein
MFDVPDGRKMIQHDNLKPMFTHVLRRSQDSNLVKYFGLDL